MISITEKTLQDLEFTTILETISNYCVTELGKEKAFDIKPIADKGSLFHNLQCTSEYLASFSNNNALPNHGFETINYELKFLGIEDSYLETPSFRKIATLSETVQKLLAFLKKFHDLHRFFILIPPPLPAGG